MVPMEEDFVERITPGKKFQKVVLQEHFNRYQFVINFIKNKHVLDAACGTGYGSEFLLTNGAKSVIGLDRSKSAISFAKNNYKNPNLKFKVGNVEKTPFKSKTFDVICALEILEHLSNPMDFLLECQRILKPDGCLIISTPNKNNSLITTTFNPFHEHEYFISEFKQFLKPFFNKTNFYGQNIQEDKKSKQILIENELVEMPIHIDDFELDDFYAIKNLENENRSYFLGVCKKPHLLTKKELHELKNKTELEHFKQLSTSLEKIALNKSSDPLSLLLGMYYLRRDLQESFPEVVKGDYDRLIQWASDTSKGITKDYLKSELKKFSRWYQHEREIEDVKERELSQKQKQLKRLENDLKQKNSALQISEKSSIELYELLNNKKREIKNYKEKLNVSNTELENYKEKLNVSNTELENYKEKLNVSNTELENYKEQINRLSIDIENLKNELETIKKSYVMKMLKKIDKSFADGTRKGELKKIIIRSLGTISDEGFKNYLSQTKTKIQRKEFHVVDPIPESLNNFPEISLTQIKEECDKFKYKPKISVLMPTYKTKLEWLDSAIQSLKSQVYENWELCICDDFSKSNELKDRLNFHSKQDKRIKITWSKSNNGIATATNNALSLATGEFVLFLDHDDELPPDAMFEIVKALNEDKNLDFIYSDEDKINDVGNYIEPFYKPDFSIHLLRSLNYLVHAAVIRRDFVKKVGGLNKKFDGAQDYDLFLRVLEKTNRIHHIKKILYHWRKVSGSDCPSGREFPFGRRKTSLRHWPAGMLLWKPAVCSKRLP